MILLYDFWNKYVGRVHRMWNNITASFTEGSGYAGNTTTSTTEAPEYRAAFSDSESLPWAVVGAAIGVAVFLIFFVFGIIFYIQRRRKLNGLLKTQMEKPSSSPGLAGMVARHPIQFVLPSMSSGDTSKDERSDNNNDEYGSRGSISRPLNFKKPHTLDWYTISPHAIERDLYISSEPEDGGKSPSVTGLGRLGFSLHYFHETRELRVKIISATCLAPKIRRQVSCPHVKVTLFPDKSQKFFTKIQRNTANPVFNEEIGFLLQWPDGGFSVSSSSTADDPPFEDKGLRITVCDFDRFSRRIIIGQVYMSLVDLGITAGCSQDVVTGELWRDLMDDMSPTQVEKGEIFLSLCYNPDTAILTLGIEKTRNLHPPRNEKDIVAVYVKITLFDKGKIVKSKKTDVRKKTNEPVFEESFDIRIPRQSLKDVHCVISVCSRNRLGSRQVIGRTMVGSQTHVTGQGLDHWTDAMASHKSTVGQWHVLM